MKILRLAAALLACVAPTLVAQTSAPSKDQGPSASRQPLIADVHPSPYRSKIYYSTNISNQRFDMRDATLLDMISFAYKVQDDGAIIGGPPWITFDHYDITIEIPGLKPSSYNGGPMDRTDPDDQIRPAMQRVLAERFQFAYHTDQRPLPGYVVTVSKDGAKLGAAKDPAGKANCHSEPDKANPGQFLFTCTSETVNQFLDILRGAFTHPVIDHTGLTKPYDFSLRFSFKNIRTREEYIQTISDGISKQLGLAINLGNVPQSAIVIDKLDHEPTPNQPDISRFIPPLADLEFEVASIKLAAPSEPHGMIRPSGSQITFTGFSMQDLLVEAWQLPTGAMLGNPPAWIDQTRFTILAKLPSGIDARGVFQNSDEMDHMLQKLLIDRFGIKYHWGEQKQDGWVLLSDGTPRMKKADPSERTFCKYGPPDGEKRMNTADSPFDNQSHCQNVTMAQFSVVLQNLAKSEIKNRVQDKTGLAGSYDFTFYYSSTRKLRAQAAAAVAAAKDSGNASSDPVDGMSIQDAFRKELGLKLEKRPGTYPALMLDQINQSPTEN